jgi:ATP-dependent Clp protease ATP-binding subunit ClpA
VLSRNLEKSLHRALAHANERRHEYATLEHLLLALTEDQDAVAVLRACSVELERLRREVLNYVTRPGRCAASSNWPRTSRPRPWCVARFPIRPP